MVVGGWPRLAAGGRLRKASKLRFGAAGACGRLNFVLISGGILMFRSLFGAVVACAVLAGGPVWPACGPGGTDLVSCTLKGGKKRLETCLNGDVAIYRYGPNGGAPELELARHVRDVHMTPWPGVSRTIWEEFGFANDGVVYMVHYAVERVPEAGPMTGGITVMRGEAILAELTCDAGSVLSSGYALPLFDAKEAAGQCWSYDTHSWGGC